MTENMRWDTSHTGSAGAASWISSSEIPLATSDLGLTGFVNLPRILRLGVGIY